MGLVTHPRLKGVPPQAACHQGQEDFCRWIRLQTQGFGFLHSQKVPLAPEITTRFSRRPFYSWWVPFLLLALLWIGTVPLLAEDTNAPARPAEEVSEVQGVKIWKRGTPTNGYTTIANESLMNITWPEAQNRIAMGVKARKGNAAIVTSMVPFQRMDITQNTGINRLDGMNVRYTIILLKP